jgi:hypothetical protein
MMKRFGPWLASVACVAAAALALRWQGRLWACACERVLLWTPGAWSADNSQHLSDPYTFTHVLHGFIFAGALALLLPRLSWRWRFALAVAAESLWEFFENTEFVIRRYREAAGAFGYFGDTVLNSVGDILACALGFLIARRLGLRRSLVVFAATELVLLFWIRDSLLLNILMLVYPLDAVRAWQAGA